MNNVKSILTDNFKKSTRDFLVSIFSKKQSMPEELGGYSNTNTKAWLNYSGKVGQYPSDFLELPNIIYLYSIVHESLAFKQDPSQSELLELISAIDGTY